MTEQVSSFYVAGWDELEVQQRDMLTQKAMEANPGKEVVGRDSNTIIDESDAYEHFSCLAMEIGDIEAEIDKWQRKPDLVASEATAIENKVTELRSKLASLKQQFEASDTVPKPVQTPAPVVAFSDGPAKPQSNKSEKTLIFEAKVLELMGKFWNDRTPGTEPTKSELCKLVYAEILRTNIRGERKTTQSMVTDAAKPWRIPLVLPVYVADSKFNDKRHPFKGEK